MCFLCRSVQNITYAKIGNLGIQSHLDATVNTHEPLVKKERIIFPPLHITLCLMIMFSFFPKRCTTIIHISSKLVKILQGKLRIFVGTHIRQLIDDAKYVLTIGETE